MQLLKIMPAPADTRLRFLIMTYTPVSNHVLSSQLASGKILLGWFLPRLFYGGNRTIDSRRIPIDIAAPPIDGWKKLPFDGDFDGKGPSTLCGEVVAVNNGAPEAGRSVSQIDKQTSAFVCSSGRRKEGERIIRFSPFLAA
jgi:hypothetical protein